MKLPPPPPPRQREGRLRAVVAAGGDGTLAEIVNRTEPDTPLAVYPLGTANLLSNYLAIVRQAKSFADMLAAAQAVRLDAGRVRPLAPDPAPDQPGVPPQPAADRSAGRIFLITAGIGFDAAVVERLHKRRTGHIRFGSYLEPILTVVRNYSYPQLRCEWSLEGEDRVMDGNLHARWLFIQNLPCYAGGLNFAPNASATDGRLDVCRVRARLADRRLALPVASLAASAQLLVGLPSGLRIPNASLR